MLDSTWETEDGRDGWNRLAFTGGKWVLVNMSFKPNIILDDFVEKYKCLKA